MYLTKINKNQQSLELDTYSKELESGHMTSSQVVSWLEVYALNL
jgi:hypothetical protein